MLSIPQIYSLFTWLVAGGPNKETYVHDYVQARPGDRILDIGCGPGGTLGQLPRGVLYEGFDPSESYIRAAKAKWGNRGNFRCAEIAQSSVAPANYDLVLANRVLHHLDDREAAALFGLAYHALKPGGRLVTVDGCYVEGQSRMARYLLSKDRGRNVRTEREYVDLAHHAFALVEIHIRHDLLRIPYTHIILVCQR